MTTDWASVLEGVRYERRAHDLVRFEDNEDDERIAEFTRAFVAADGPERSTLRERLAERDCYTLLTFSRRRAAYALRVDVLACAIEALRSLCAVTRSKIDFRDLSIDFPLHAVGRLGGDVAQELQVCIEMCEPDTASVFAARVGSAPEGPTLASCALIEVTSSHGLGFMRRGAARRRPEDQTLAGIAIRLADAIDGEGSYRCDPPALSDLPTVWFESPPESYGRNLPVVACVGFHAFAPVAAKRMPSRLLMFLAEFADPLAATAHAALAMASATPRSPRLAIADDHLLVLIIAGPASANEASIETQASLTRFEPLIASIH